MDHYLHPTRTKNNEATASFQTALEKSLAKNRHLQSQILSTLTHLGSEMAKNRRLASKLTRELHLVSETVSKTTATSSSATASSATASSASEKGTEQKPISGDHTALLIKDVDPYRQWTRDYFQDHLGRIPEPNADVGKRRRLEENEAQGLFYHLSPPWDKEENKILKFLINKQQQEEEEEAENDNQTVVVVVDYEKVATELQKRSVSNQNQDDFPCRKPRTAEECRIQYQRFNSEQQPAMTKVEIKQVLESVHRQQQTQSTVDWNRVAANIGNERSPWQCLVAYNKAQNNTSITFTPAQDELLFKFVCAMGPQFVTTAATLAEMSIRLFPDKYDRKIATRVNQSLLNPKLRHEFWSMSDQRKLVLAQKVYRDQTMRPPSHFPHRSAYSVRDKWNRSLDPAFIRHKPFSKKEDQLLTKVARSYLSQLQPDALIDKNGNGRYSAVIPWTKVAREHFPDRRPEQLCERWNRNLASDRDLLTGVKARLLKKQAIFTNATLPVASTDTQTTTNSSAAIGGEGKEAKSVAAAETDLSSASLDDLELKVIPTAAKPRRGRGKRKRSS